MYGSLSDKSLEKIHSLFDFTRCKRADGSFYGTSGKCRKGTQVAAPERSGRGDLKRAVEQNLEAISKDPAYAGDRDSALAEMKKNYGILRPWVLGKNAPLNNPENRARLIGLKLAIWQKEKELTSSEFNLKPNAYKNALANSPRYVETPGSREPIKKPSSKEQVSLVKEQERLFRRMNSAESQEEKLKISQELLEITSRLQDASSSKRPKSPGLVNIYKEQGFDAKPELVGTVSDLKNRGDILTHRDGSPMILYRGVSTVEFSNQFKGIGPEGETHYPGKGIYGNGSYAASAKDTNVRGSSPDAVRTARSYAGIQENLNQKVTAFAFRSDANVVTFPGSERARKKAYEAWELSVLDEAENKTGYSFRDVGEAAAALGIHAYQVPTPKYEDYFVVLNRGSIIAAMDSGLVD